MLKLKKYFKWLLFIFLILIFLLLAKDLANNSLASFDNRIYDFIKNFINSQVTKVVKIITRFANPEVLIFLAGIILILYKNKRHAFLILLNLSLIGLLNIILKFIFQRVRPLDINLITESGYSFPSGHSMSSLAFYGFLIYLIWQSNYSRKMKTIITIIFSFLIFMIGISRIYLGVHFASDVLAGFSFALAYLIVFTTFISKYVLQK